jgi:hypothetical protein
MIDHNFDAHQHKYRGTHVSFADLKRPLAYEAC